MTQEILQRAKELEAGMKLLAEDADNCQTFIDEPDGQDYFISFGPGNFRVIIPKTVLVDALKIIHKGITDQYEKVKQEFESL